MTAVRIAAVANQMGTPMWPVSEISLPTAARVSDWANLALILSLVVGVVSTLLIVKMGNIKEAHWDTARTASAERISSLAVQAEQLRTDAAEANARTKEAELKLEQLRRKVAPRQIDGKAFLAALVEKPKPPAPVEILFPRDDAEAYQLSMQVRDYLKMATWECREPAAIPPTEAGRFAHSPSTVGAGGQPSGVTIVVRAETQADFALTGDRAANTPLNALILAFLTSLGSYSVAANSETAPEKGVLRVVVGSKP